MGLIERLVDYAAFRGGVDPNRRAPGGDWRETDATITECSSYCRRNTGRTMTVPVVHFAVKFSYEVEGRSFNGEFQSSVPYRIGHEFKLSYDPSHPNKNTASERRWIKPLVWCTAILVLCFAVWWKNR